MKTKFLELRNSEIYSLFNNTKSTELRNSEILFSLKDH